MKSAGYDNSKMPILFFGHGSPMNAIDDNDYTKALSALSLNLPTPKAILVISAHWQTNGVWVTGMDKPKVIYDFYGFPEELYQIKYNAQGLPALASTITTQIEIPQIRNDLVSWGLDHGAWAVLKHIYPNADIPVIQLSLAQNMTNQFHFELGQKLSFLRNHGVLIIGSGNIVHNLSKVNWDILAKPYDWAIEFDEFVKKQLQLRNFNELINNARNTTAGQLSIPTSEHFLPLYYILGATRKEDELTFLFEGMQNASMSMRCLSFS